MAEFSCLDSFVGRTAEQPSGLLPEAISNLGTIWNSRTGRAIQIVTCDTYIYIYIMYIYIYVCMYVCNVM